MFMNKKAFLTTLPDFVEIQRASFCWFLSKGLSEELEKFSSITDLYKFVELNSSLIYPTVRFLRIF